MGTPIRVAASWVHKSAFSFMMRYWVAGSFSICGSICYSWWCSKVGGGAGFCALAPMGAPAGLHTLVYAATGGFLRTMKEWGGNEVLDYARRQLRQDAAEQQLLVAPGCRGTAAVSMVMAMTGAKALRRGAGARWDAVRIVDWRR